MAKYHRNLTSPPFTPFKARNNVSRSMPHTSSQLKHGTRSQRSFRINRIQTIDCRLSKTTNIHSWSDSAASITLGKHRRERSWPNLNTRAQGVDSPTRQGIIFPADQVNSQNNSQRPESIMLDGPNRHQLSLSLSFAVKFEGNWFAYSYPI